MSTSESLIDFTKLVSPVPGEGLEQMTRRIGMKKGLSTQWSGRGPDQGRDLLFVETRSGPLGKSRVKWVVSCKDRARSGQSVSERDLPSVGDKVAQHKAHGFLLVTTTTVSASAKALLDGLDVSKGGDIHTLVWDATELEALLLQTDYQGILCQFLPESYQSVKGLTSVEGALNALREQVPADVLSEIQRLVGPYSKPPRVGLEIWPYDAASASSIDQIMAQVLSKGGLANAVSATEQLEFDAFMALVASLHEYYPRACFDYLSAVVVEHDDPDVRFNAAQFLLDHYELSPVDQIRVATCFDSETLNELYGWEIAAFVEEELLFNTLKHDVYQSVDELSSATRVERVSITKLEIGVAEDQRIRFGGHMQVRVTYVFDREDMGSQQFPGLFSGFFDEHGMYLESATVDTSTFYK